jgi:hypothetical protein
MIEITHGSTENPPTYRTVVLVCLYMLCVCVYIYIYTLLEVSILKKLTLFQKTGKCRLFFNHLGLTV